MVWLWIQEEPQEGYNSNKEARGEFLRQVDILHLYFSQITVILIIYFILDLVLMNEARRRKDTMK